MADARAFLRLAAPFFAALLGSSPVVRDESIPTACVNERGEIRVNPGFFLSLGITERAALLAHEIMHPAWGVFWRSKSLSHDPLLSNIAHDFVINLVISQSYPNWSVPGWLMDTRYSGMSYEEVYRDIEKNQSQKRDKIPGAGRDVVPDGSGSLDAGKDESSWRDRVVGAFQTALAMGSVPAGLERAVTGLLEPEIDWRDKLLLAIHDAVGRTRLDWSSPGRRSDSLKIHTPSEISLGYDVSIAIDTSGSVSEDNLRRACSEIQSIVSEAGGDGRFLVGDAAVHRDVMLSEFDAGMICGGGGTSFVPVFDHLEAAPTRLLIYFTDTFGEFPENEPDYPVIWAVYQNAADAGAKIPFGEMVVIPDA
jgi:predicted metal-dependent peptidase